MKRVLFIILLLPLFLGCGCNRVDIEPVKVVGVVPSFENGMEKGVSACYVAIYDGSIYLAGGCNFPETPAADGGAKRYYKGIYKAVAGDTLVWESVASLPCESAYGAFASCGGKLYIAGGITSCGAQKSVLCVNLKDNCKVDTLAPLPYAVDNCAGAFCGNRLFVVGGNCDGKASNRVFYLNLSDSFSQWEELSVMPSRGRVQPVCVATDDALYVWGGFSPADSGGDVIVHTDGCCYDFSSNEWSTLGDIAIDGNVLTLSGGAAAPLCDGKIVAAGGVNKDIFADAVSGRYTMVEKENYMHKPAEWYRFNSNMLVYDTELDVWLLLRNDAAFARAGAAIVADSNRIYSVCGELKPGIRSPHIYSIKR